MEGSYTIVLELGREVKLEVGSLGTICFSQGFYAYNGSAFGPGGLKRVERHRKKSRNGGSTHWHIDYLLVNEDVSVADCFKQESDHECSLSQEMSELFEPVQGFGCSDCGCGAHLFYSKDKGKLEDFLGDFYSNQESL